MCVHTHVHVEETCKRRLDYFISVPLLTPFPPPSHIYILPGLLYAIGGFDGVSPLKSGEHFDIATNKWIPIPDMTTKRFGLGACAYEGEAMDYPCYLPIPMHGLRTGSGSGLKTKLDLNLVFRKKEGLGEERNVHYPIRIKPV